MRSLLYLLLIITVAACSNDNSEEGLITSSPYFPLEQGKYIDYAITEVIYSDNGATKDTLSYFLREETVANRPNSEGEDEYIIDRLTKTTEEAPWVYQESWRALFSENQVLRIEDNLTFVKINLPIENGDTWDGNSFFDPLTLIKIGGQELEYYKGWTSIIEQTSTPVIVGSRQFDNAINISLANTENRIEIREASEIYASGIGLVSKVIRVLDTQCFQGCDNIPWEEKAEKGHIFSQHIIAHN